MKPVRFFIGKVVEVLSKKEIEQQAEAQMFTSAEMASILGISIRYLQKLTQDGVLVKAGHGRYEIASTVQAFVAFKTGQAESANQEELDFKKEKTLLTRTQRQKAEVELAVMEGKLHRGEDVEAVMNTMLTTFRTRCLVIPTRISPLLVGKTLLEIKAALNAEIRDVLSELSDYDPAAFGQEQEEE